MMPFGKYHRSWLALAACCFLCAPTGGTQPWAKAVSDSVRQLFDKPRKVKVRHFYALFDDCYALSVSLGFTRKEVKGLATYLSSRDRLQLQGRRQGDTLILAECDAAGKCAATWILLPKGETDYVGEWVKYDGTTGFSIRMWARNAPPDIPRPCNTDKWIAHYEGWKGGSWLGLWLHRTAEGRLYGHGLWGQTPLLVKGYARADSAALSCYDEQGRPLATLHAYTGKARQWFARVRTTYGETSSWTLARTQLLQTDCFAWAEYRSSYDFFFPKTAHHAFNQWVEQLVRQWMKTCRQTTTDYRKRHAAAPARRAALRSTGWWEITFADTQYISGLACLAATWQTHTRCRTFIFDLERGTRLDPWQEFFQPGSRPKVLAQVESCLQRHTLASQAGFAEWVQQSLQQVQIALHPYGLSFHLPPHPLFGRVQCTLSAQELAPWLAQLPLPHLKTPSHGHQ